MSLVAPLLDSPPLRRQSAPTVYRGASPVAGANFVQHVDDGLWWRVVSVFARIVTSADVADREVTIEYRDQEDNVYARFGAPVAVEASSTYDFYFSAFRSTSEWPVNLSVLTVLDPLLLPQGHDFAITVAAIDNTDQLSRIRYVAEKFYAPGADYYPAFE